jgi:nucleoside-diphosphate-sugar epimerase
MAEWSADEVHGIVIRPGILYGRSGSLPGMMVFKAALEAQKNGEQFEAIGMRDARFGTIHQDDLADLFLRVAERVCPSPGETNKVKLMTGIHLPRQRIRRTQPPI